ncbi:endonuclease dU [Candidatus Alkanophaga liquidiphilum]
MELHLSKRGIRVLGVAESFVRRRNVSVLAGVVMRPDSQIDGVAVTKITVGGMDATAGVLQIFESLQRNDLNAIMLNGCIISWFNIIDINKVHDALGIPVLCVTYEPSEGLEEHFKAHFDDWEQRVAIYKSLGERTPVRLRNGHSVFVRALGMTIREARTLLNKFTTHGKVPEPLRVARIFARAVLRSGIL